MKTFKTTGACIPSKNYMVDLSSRLEAIKAMVDQGDYFTINRARQFGKTTTLTALQAYLTAEYDVISLDFQGISSIDFQTEISFVNAFCRMIKREKYSGLSMPNGIENRINNVIASPNVSLSGLFDVIAEWCACSPKKLVLIIDEVDSATNNQVFLDFLAQLRDVYLRRDTRNTPTFQSFILAGVTDVKNLRRKIRPEDEHKFNSPWNIAADFNVDMSFNAADISGMLREYEADHHTGMDVDTVAQTIEAYTSGYPFLVSRICQLLDQDATLRWNQEGISEIVRRILMEKNTLFDSLMGKVHDNDRLREVLWRILFAGESISYNPDDISISDAEMYGLVCNNHGTVKITNRIFETRLYNFFLSQAEMDSPSYKAGAEEKSQFISNGRLDMEHVISRFVEIYDDLYGDSEETFVEAEGRQRFLLYVRPIINGTGNYYVESQTRNNKRMDLVIDYKGERFVIELKIWHGSKYHADGEGQLVGYLRRMKLNKGYMLTYSFIKSKQIGVKTVMVEGKELFEAIV
ncbi:MAG: AAA-like domain-containing protein [Clostridia bacterium]|nr:AAA-like domain-containing protein [Clostridia bacterium]